MLGKSRNTCTIFPASRHTIAGRRYAAFISQNCNVSLWHNLYILNEVKILGPRDSIGVKALHRASPSSIPGTENTIRVTHSIEPGVSLKHLWM